MASRKFLVDVEVDGIVKATNINATGKVTGDNIGDKLLFFINKESFPTVGEDSTLYISNTTGFLYKYTNGTYVLIGSGSSETGYINVDGGNARSVYTQWQKIDGGNA